MRLARSVVRILSQYDHPHVFEGRGIERSENLRTRRVNHCSRVFTLEQKAPQFTHVRLVKLRFQPKFPR